MHQSTADAEPDKVLPSFSIVTSVLNGADYISDCLLSVYSQPGYKIEHIVVDGGSTDETVKVIQKFQQEQPGHFISLIRAPGTSLYEALKLGLEASTNEIFSYLNADDWYLPGGLSVVANEILKSQENDVVYFDGVVSVQGWLYRNLSQPEKIHSSRLKWGHIMFQESVFARTSMIKRVGGFSGSELVAGDYDLWVRLAKECQFRKGSGHVAVFTLRPGQLSENMVRYSDEMARIVRRNTRLVNMFIPPRVLKWAHFRYNRIRIRAGMTRLAARKPLKEQIESWNIHNSNWSSGGPRIDIAQYFKKGLFPICPVGQEVLNNFAFLASDPRFPSDEATPRFFCETHSLVSSAANVSSKELSFLHQEFYSSEASRISREGDGVPFKFFGRRNTLRRMIELVPLERIPQQFLPEVNRDRTGEEVLSIVELSNFSARDELSVLTLGGIESKEIQSLSKLTNWHLVAATNLHGAATLSCGTRPNIMHVDLDRVQTFELQEKFDVILMPHIIDHARNPTDLLASAKRYLNEGGVIVISTPNLLSRQLAYFGPTWSSWHHTHRLNVFSEDALKEMAHQVGLDIVVSRTHSSPHLSSLSYAINERGVFGPEVDSVKIGKKKWRGLRIDLLAHLFWNRRSHGENLYVVLRPRKVKMQAFQLKDR